MSCCEIVRFFCKCHISDKMNHRYVYAKETNCIGVVILQRDTWRQHVFHIAGKNRFSYSHLLGKWDKSDFKNFFISEISIIMHWHFFFKLRKADIYQIFGENDFAKVSRNLSKYRYRIILLHYQNNYVGISKMMRMLQKDLTF